jgi:hypothetical protein
MDPSPNLPRENEPHVFDGRDRRRERLDKNRGSLMISVAPTNASEAELKKWHGVPPRKLPANEKNWRGAAPFLAL